MKTQHNILLKVIAAATLLMASSTFAASSKDMFYLFELNAYSGYHMFSETSDWTSSKKSTINNDVLRKDETDFYSTNSASVDPTWSGAPMIDLEALVGVNLKNMPGLTNVKALKKFQGFRAGAGLTFYPFTSTTSYEYSGKLNYVTANPRAPELAELNYSTTMSIEEELFMIAPSIRMYYFYEPGLMKGKLIPFGGLEIGAGIISGNRKLVMESKSLDVTTTSGLSETHNINAQIQESFISSIGFRFGMSAGAQYNLGGPHSLNLRLGFILQENTVELDRGGTFNEDITDNNTGNVANYSSSTGSTKTVTFSQTGFYVQLGYTVGLL